MTAAAIASIFGETEDATADTGPSKADQRDERAAAKDADRQARMQAKAEAKAARAEEKAAAKAVRDEHKAARDEERAAARKARAEEKAAARAAKLEARAAAKAAAEATTEPEVDDSDAAERPIAVAAKLQQDREDAEQREREAREAKEQAAQAKREAAEARKAQKAEHAAARQKEREEAAAAKAAAKAAREEARAAVRFETESDADDDHIVEAPREPKKSLLERIRPAETVKPGDDEDAPSTLLPTLAVVLGALGFVFSVILAIGAFMVALNPQDDGGLFNVVSNICDALVGPLRGLFSFSGVNGESKDALVAWGLGALGYLVLGLFAQSFLRSRSEED